MDSKKKLLLKLFISTFYLSAFTFGGGYVIVTLMKKKFVDVYHWIDEDEMLDLIAIAQSAPGVMAVNGAIVVGYKLAGLIGSFVAIVATVLPPFITISIVSVFYTAFKDNVWVSLMLEGMESGVGAVIASVVYDMGKGVFMSKKKELIAIMLIAFVLNCFLNISVVYIVIACGALGYFQTLYKRRRAEK